MFQTLLICNMKVASEVYSYIVLVEFLFSGMTC